MGSVERREPPSDTELTSVVIDGEKGSIHGCDTSVELAFSPMRFVYLQQLWLEITDYFFEGLLGYEVWGKLRPSEEEMEDASRSSTGRRANVADQQNNPKALHERGDLNQTGQVDGNFILGSDAAGLRIGNGWNGVRTYHTVRINNAKRNANETKQAIKQ